MCLLYLYAILIFFKIRTNYLYFNFKYCQTQKFKVCENVLHEYIKNISTVYIDIYPSIHKE